MPPGALIFFLSSPHSVSLPYLFSFPFFNFTLLYSSLCFLSRRMVFPSPTAAQCVSLLSSHDHRPSIGSQLCGDFIISLLFSFSFFILLFFFFLSPLLPPPFYPFVPHLYLKRCSSLLSLTPFSLFFSLFILVPCRPLHRRALG